MTLVTIGWGFALVALLFLVWGWLGAGRRLNRQAAAVLAGEALALTLLAVLWFASLGHGSWLLIFLLLGCLVSGAERGLRFALLRSGGGAELRGFGLGVARYVVAGAILAWSLG